MRVQTFLGKVSMEALQQMDEHINQWLEAHQVEPKLVSQTFGYAHCNEAREPQPTVITSVWY